jgi:small subunit ribosomal protein S27e
MQLCIDEKRYTAQKTGDRIMAEWEHLIPRPTSRFFRVRCISCDSEQIVFSHSTNEVKCQMCGETLAEPTGGKANIHGSVVAVLG